MSHECYHCEQETDDVHLISFFQSNQEHNELLCPTCYADWLEAIKYDP